MGLLKLKITPLKENVTKYERDKKLDDGNAVECQFNPESISMSKNNRYSCRLDIGDSTPEVDFSGGESGSMSLELVFDSTDTGDDVRELYSNLITIALIKPSGNKDGKGEPRQVVVQWGSFMSYVAVIQSISQNFTFFAEDGTPLRANVSVSLKEIVDDSDTTLAGTNPTSRTEARRTWVVEKGQRIEWIAYNVFGMTSAWRHLADTNNLLNPTALRPGQILKIVPLN
jgi:hypothetical protein